MKDILFRKIYGEPTVRGDDENGYAVIRGSKERDGGKDIIAHCNTLAEAKELIRQLKEIEITPPTN